MEVKIGVQHAPRELVRRDRRERRGRREAGRRGGRGRRRARAHRHQGPPDRSCPATSSPTSRSAAASPARSASAPDPRRPGSRDRAPVRLMDRRHDRGGASVARKDRDMIDHPAGHSSAAPSSACSASCSPRRPRQHPALADHRLRHRRRAARQLALHALFDGDDTAGLDWWRHVWQVVVAAVLVDRVGRSPAVRASRSDAAAVSTQGRHRSVRGRVDRDLARLRRRGRARPSARRAAR